MIGHILLAVSLVGTAIAVLSVVRSTISVSCSTSAPSSSGYEKAVQLVGADDDGSGVSEPASPFPSPTAKPTPLRI